MHISMPQGHAVPQQPSPTPRHASLPQRPPHQPINHWPSPPHPEARPSSPLQDPISRAKLLRKATMTTILSPAPFMACALFAPTPQSQAMPASGQAADAAALDVFDRCSELVVAVGTISSTDGEFRSIASGLIWAPGYYIVTAYSPVNVAVRQQRQVLVALARLPGQQRPSNEQQAGIVASKTMFVPASVVGRDPALDLMVLKIDGENIALSKVGGGGGGIAGTSAVMEDDVSSAFLTLSLASRLKVGQDVYAIGSTPEGSRTLSRGVLSATGRAFPAPNGQLIKGALQTDAEVSPLGLGGALFDSSGNVIGMPTTRYSKEGFTRGSGVSFAVSSDALLSAVPNLIAYGNSSGRR